VEECKKLCYSDGLNNITRLSKPCDLKKSTQHLRLPRECGDPVDKPLPEGVISFVEAFEISRRYWPLRGIFCSLDPRIREEDEGVRLS
jgi:hypothetical protein